MKSEKKKNKKKEKRRKREKKKEENDVIFAYRDVGFAFASPISPRLFGFFFSNLPCFFPYYSHGGRVAE